MTSENLCVFGLCQPAFVVNSWLGILTAVAAASAVAIAWYQLRQARREEAIRATFSLIDYETSREWIEREREVQIFLASLDHDPNRVMAVILASIKAPDLHMRNGQPIHRLVNDLLARREYVAMLLRPGGGDLHTYLEFTAVNVAREGIALAALLDLSDELLGVSFDHFRWLANEAKQFCESRGVRLMLPSKAKQPAPPQPMPGTSAPSGSPSE